MKHKLVIAMTAATLFLVGCGQRQHTEQVTLVRIDTVKTANTCDILEFPARVQAAGEVHLAFKIPGTLQRIYVDDGAFVRQGELVAEMDPRDYELQLQAVEAEYLSIKAEAERVMALYDQNVATADAYDKARYGLQQITAKYENARNQLADTKLYAPFDGYVKRRRFDPSDGRSGRNAGHHVPVGQESRGRTFHSGIDLHSPSGDRFVCGGVRFSARAKNSAASAPCRSERQCQSALRRAVGTAREYGDRGDTRHERNGRSRHAAGNGGIGRDSCIGSVQQRRQDELRVDLPTGRDDRTPTGRSSPSAYGRNGDDSGWSERRRTDRRGRSS